MKKYLNNTSDGKMFEQVGEVLISLHTQSLEGSFPSKYATRRRPTSFAPKNAPTRPKFFPHNILSAWIEYHFNSIRIDRHIIFFMTTKISIGSVYVL